MTPSIYNFNDRYKNDTSNEVKFTITKTIDTIVTPVDLTGVAIIMKLKKGVASTTSIKTFSVSSGITLTDATNGVFAVDAFIVDVDAFKYLYDIQITFTDGVVRTYLKGNFKVNQDIS